MIELKGLYKRYGRKEVIRDFSLKLDSGSFFGFTAENGEGKTTLLKMAACLLQPDRGEIYVDGINALENPFNARRHIGYVPDNFGMYNGMTVREYMEFYAGTYGLEGMKARNIYMDLLEQLHMEQTLDEYVDVLSKGTKQRLCMARALIHNPDVLILDEPFTGIDAEQKADMNRLCRQMVSDGKTVMFSSHQLQDMSDICTCVGVLKEGSLAAFGTMDELSQRINLIRAIEISVIGDPELLRKRLHDDPRVKAIGIDGQTIRINGKFTEEDEAQILNELITEGYKISSFARDKNLLEQIFKKVLQEKKGGVHFYG